MRLLMLCALLALCGVQGVLSGVLAEMGLPEKDIGDLTVEYGGVEIVQADTLTEVQTKSEPVVKFSRAKESARYTLIMHDPDAPGRNGFQHWLVTNIMGSDLKELGNIKGNVRVSYQGPTPPQGTGTHRYVLMVFEQTTGVIDVPAQSNRGSAPPATLASTYNLELAAANYFNVNAEM